MFENGVHLVTIATIRKALTPLVTGLIGWTAVVIHSPSGVITANEWWGLGVVVATALGVYAIPNAE